MGTKHRDSNQMELFDGQAVEKYQLAFKGTAFHSDEVDIEKLAMDDHVCLLVIASVAESGFKKNNEEDVIRVNKLQPLRVVELEPTIADYALAKQKAAAGSPMLPNFSDPDDEDMPQPDDTGDTDSEQSVANEGNAAIDADIQPLAEEEEEEEEGAFEKPDGIVLSGR